MTPLPRIAALIVAAGKGVRVGGDVPKQYQPIGCTPMLAYSIAALCRHPRISEVVVAISPEHEGWYEEMSLMERDHAPPANKVHGGARRCDSVRAGLAALADHAPDYVMIHDAARPFLSHAMIDALIAKLAPDVGVLPALAVPDTVRRHTPEGWSDIPRDGLLRMQTPQCFPFAALAALHEKAQGDATDDAALWLEAGKKLEYVEGDERLRKVTNAADMAWAQSALPRTPRTALGVDVHRLVPHAPGAEAVLWLGGVAIAHEAKLEGHSDADVVLHAITDALLGTIADGDIGAHFPPSDPCFKGADSEMFVRHAAQLLANAGGVVTYVDVTILCEAPKIAPHRDAMRARIAGLLGITMAQVSVKASTTEGLGFTGRREGIAAQALVNVMMETGL